MNRLKKLFSQFGSNSTERGDKRLIRSLSKGFVFPVILLVVIIFGAYFFFPAKTVHKQIYAASEANWYDNNWSYRKEITIDHTKVPNTDQSDFPVLISLTDSGLQAHARSDGHDILFTDDTGNQIPYEREQYESSTGTLVAWVKVATLSSSTDTILYMYYGNSGASDQQDSTGGTWNNNFKGVWHSNDASPTTIADSTANANTGTKYGTAGPVETTGKIGKAQSYDGSDNYIGIVPSGTLASSFTVSAWAKVPDDENTYTVIGTRGPLPSDQSFDFKFDNGDDIIHGDIGDGTNWIATDADTTSFNYTADTWYQITYSVTPTGYTIYINGNEAASGSYDENTPLLFDPTHNFFIGQVGYDDEWFNGAIDEVRVSDIARSADWIQTEYNNQNNPAAFYSLGSEESVPVYTLTYTAGANGYITGTSSQMVKYGADGTAVTAMPNTGYHFVKWSDNSTDNPRTDTIVTADISVTANFASDDITPPTIANITSAKANGAYKAGTVIDINLTFLENVTSTGNVTVNLDTGGSCSFIITDSSTGSCNYTVNNGENSADLNVSSVSGTIKDAADNSMVDFTPATNLAANKDLFIDTTAPSTSGTPSTTSPTNNNKPTWSWTASTDFGSGLADPAYSVQWCGNSGFTGCDANTSTSNTSSFTHSSSLADGTWYFRAKASDVAGNNSAFSSNGSVLIDTTPPTLSFTDNVAAGPVLFDIITATWGDATVTKWDYDADGVCSTNAGDYSNSSPPITTQTTEANNTKYICLYGEDALGNKSTLSSANPINIDITAPVITIIAPTKLSNSTIADTTVHITDNNAVIVVDVTVDSSTTAGYSNFNCTQTDSKTVDCTIIITSSGNLVIKAIDNLTNSATQAENNYIIDTIAPIITITAPTKTANTSITDTTIHLTDNLGILAANVTINSSTTAGTSDLVCAQTDSKTVDCTIHINSSGNLIIHTVDNEGNTASQTENGYSIDTTTPLAPGTPSTTPTPASAVNRTAGGNIKTTPGVSPTPAATEPPKVTPPLFDVTSEPIQPAQRSIILFVVISAVAGILIILAAILVRRWIRARAVARMIRIR